MKKDYISVIIPVYNAENYLHRCLNSIIKQTYEKLEILIINDGSTDGSSKICDEYASQYPEIVRVFHQKNMGVSVARNVGIENSIGEFISFVDADDWIAIDMLEKLHSAIEKNNVNISICGYFEVNSANIVAKKAFMRDVKTMGDILFQNAPAFSWGKLFRSSLKDFMIYPKGVEMGEDTAMLLPLYSHAQNFIYIDEPLYYYFQNSNSATHTINNPNKMISYLEGCHIAMKNANEKYVDAIAFTIADRIISNENWFLKSCLADAIEYVSKNMMQFFVNNKYIVKHERLSKILNYPSMRLIPNRIYYDNFGCKALDKVKLMAKKSWEERSLNAEVIELNEKNCDVSTAPIYLQKQFQKGDYKEIGNYFKLKAIYENGGMAFGLNIYLNAGYGFLRTNKTFFALKNRYDFQDQIFASQAGTEICEQLLETYLEDSMYADSNVKFVERVKDILTERYGYNGAGWTVNLYDNSITVYKCDVLSYNITKNNVAQLFSSEQMRFINTEYILVEKPVMEYWEEDKNLFWANRESLKKENAQLRSSKSITYKNNKNDPYVESLLQEIKRLKNSKSWKITAPLRAISRFFRRLKTRK